MRTDFVLDALEQAMYDRQAGRTDALIHHSDRASQYVSIWYSERLAEEGIEPSVGSKGKVMTTLWLKPSTACTRLRLRFVPDLIHRASTKTGAIQPMSCTHQP